MPPSSSVPHGNPYVRPLAGPFLRGWKPGPWKPTPRCFPWRPKWRREIYDQSAKYNFGPFLKYEYADDEKVALKTIEEKFGG